MSEDTSAGTGAEMDVTVQEAETSQVTPETKEDPPSPDSTSCDPKPKASSNTTPAAGPALRDSEIPMGSELAKQNPQLLGLLTAGRSSADEKSQAELDENSQQVPESPSRRKRDGSSRASDIQPSVSPTKKLRSPTKSYRL